MAVFLRQWHFQDLLFYLKSHNSRTENVHSFGSPNESVYRFYFVLKRSIHYVIVQQYNPGELVKEIPP